MKKGKDNKRVLLCPACEGCPEVVFEKDEVLTGEKGDVAKLTKAQWNDLVRKIKKGELTEV
jgi:hypothetical protein